ncbi:hypothetical protein ACWGDT_18475 [Streptomyces avermitilis]
MAFIAVVLILTTAHLGWFGFEDFSEALTFPGRVAGTVLMLVAITTFAGAFAVLDHWYGNRLPYSGLVALIGSVAASLTNAMLLLTKGTHCDSVQYPVLWGLLTVGSVCAVIAVWRTKVAIPAPKRVTAALIFSTLLAIGNFGYQNLYQPLQRGAKPLITLNVGNAVLSKDHKQFAVPVDITLENHSDVGFYVLGTEFHAMGERVPLSPSDRHSKQWRADAEKWSKIQDKNPLSRREIHEPGELVAAQPWLPSGNWIEATDHFVTRTVVQVPMDTRYDQLAFYATASFARKDRIGLERIPLQGYSWRSSQAPQWVRKDKETDSVIYSGRVHENNAIARHTMDPRFLTVYWRFGEHGAEVSASIARKGEEDRILSGAEQRELANRYGLVDVVMGPIERTLWDLTNQR